jgi:hypothetical protein
MRRLIPVLLMVVAVPATAQKPWEQRVDLPYVPPVELPTVPPTNPFAVAVTAPPVVVRTSLLERFTATFPVSAAAYVDAEGVCKRVVFTRLPLPGLADELSAALEETEFTPARAAGTSVASWVVLGVDLAGRIDEGEVLRATAVAPDPGVPPRPEPPPPVSLDARDAALPAVPLDQLQQQPSPRRFRAKVPGQELREEIKLLVEVSRDGRPQQLVFLACPDGLRGWIVASMGGWAFQPAQSATGSITAWAEVTLQVSAEVGTLSGEALRVSRQPFPPRGAEAPSAALPPGA